MSPTLRQLVSKGRKKKVRRNKVSCLCKKPQKRVLVYKIGILPPRKPNSARRKHAKVRVLGENFKGRKTFAHIPGWGFHGLHDYSIALLEGRGPKDVPGVNYSLIRGCLDFQLPEKQRVRRRSKFGLKRSAVRRNDDYDYPRWWGLVNHKKHPKNIENAY